MTTPAPAHSLTAPSLAPFELRYLVLAAQREGNRALNRQLAEIGLTASQFEIILVLAEYGPITLKELGELIVCETASPSRIVDTLVRRDLVERSIHANDRRAVALQLTTDGTTLVPRLRAIDRGMDDGARAMFTTSEMTGLVSALRTYLDGTESGAVLERRFSSARQDLD
ncbi:MULTISPECIES: MarR family winged helix-turn-helix transcriptional regulator [unclassified Rathayibacter]|uniref:MarR family winged helix-turn-helix transcriptional regulator n=1 Tax=unclassified Rathayibacter TaxID=2609250 RepID=UPI00188BC46B|nr:MULTISPECIES: MarR family transcriptional regulator [unclassified Rathayibacter]MBF4461745.1 MarR family transcriptional regulator [Rathayibacter sp. VKM Ac-2879]MBF4503156.1 MarR family transcriptional regulator [Rathayibacter sp. VKM Ac-2878]